MWYLKVGGFAVLLLRNTHGLRRYALRAYAPLRHFMFRSKYKTKVSNYLDDFFLTKNTKSVGSRSSSRISLRNSGRTPPGLPVLGLYMNILGS